MSEDVTEVKEQTLIRVMMHEDELPALIELVRALPNDAQLLEWGSGGSTLLFAALMHDEQHLTTIEHNAQWLDTVRDRLVELKLAHRVTQLFVPLESGGPSGAQTEEIVVPNGRAYIAPTLDYASFAFVLVDGIMRNAVLDHLSDVLSPGTLVLVHDYVGREAWYSNVTRFKHVSTTHTLRSMIVPMPESAYKHETLIERDLLRRIDTYLQQPEHFHGPLLDEIKLLTSSLRPEYDPSFGDERECSCGHQYYRHFDSYEGMEPVGCKYCECLQFTA
jgi:predicted O-methyltransferase YrrM